jgi:hypothetical protein
VNKHLDFLTNLCSTHPVVFAFKSSGVWRWEDGRGKAESRTVVSSIQLPASEGEIVVPCSVLKLESFLASCGLWPFSVCS